VIQVSDYRIIKPEDWRWKNFLPAEMACHGDKSLCMDERLLDLLESVRARVRQAFPAAVLPVSSGYRSPAYNASVSETGDVGPHTTGKATDLSCAGEIAYAVVGIAFQLGFTGIGLMQKGDRAKRYVHLDILPQGIATSPRPTIWTY